MCGLSGIFGRGWERTELEKMVEVQRHRGPDARGIFVERTRSDGGMIGLGHNRLSIIDTSPAGLQPMASEDGGLRIVFNGEIYNYRELRAELGAGPGGYRFRGRTDTEVLLAAWERWGIGALERLRGMFAFLLWEESERRLIAARDRFGVKPLFCHQRADGTLLLASEIKALLAVCPESGPSAKTWATYLATGVHESGEETFWQGIRTVPAGHYLRWQDGRTSVARWYDLAARVGHGYDERPTEQVAEEYSSLLRESVRLRFRADVPVAINLSGGLDSSLLLGLVDEMEGGARNRTGSGQVRTFTFVTGDPEYDELPWVEQMVARTGHESVACRLWADEVPELAASVQAAEDEPFGGLPTLAYARLFEVARDCGIRVLLDGQGMDEQWAGYDYYRASASRDAGGEAGSAPVVQGSRGPATYAEGLTREFRGLATDETMATPFPDRLRNLQYRDIFRTKLPRALRFNDRISMRASTELREPFLDHHLVELALRQPPERKVTGDIGKVMLREVAARIVPRGLTEAPKRPLQTPQREWLRGPLRGWATEMVEAALAFGGGEWFETEAVRRRCREFLDGAGDNSYFLWQLISLGMILGTRGRG